MSISKFDSRLTLEHLTNTEGQYLERKGAETKTTKIANELIGFLNADGGILALGIHDNGSIEDLKQVHTEEKLNNYRRITHDLIKPSAPIKIEEVTLETGELIFLYHIESDCERLFQRNDPTESVYKRVADSNKGPLDREEVKNLEFDRHIRNYEEELCPDFTADYLDNITCSKYLSKLGTDKNFLEVAIARRFAVKKGGDIIFNNAGVLMFAKDPSFFINNALVRYVRYEGEQQQSGVRFNAIKDERFEFSIPMILDTLKTFLQARFRDYHYLNLESGTFEKIQEFPEDAWLEGIVNAICHRSYNIQGNPVFIKHYDDRLEISNSGPLPAQVTLENIKEQRYTRNVRIARALNDMGYVRELNEGVPRIFNSMRESMLSEPTYIDSNHTITLILKNNISQRKDTILATVQLRVKAHWPSLNKSQKSLVSALLRDHEGTVSELAKTIQVSPKNTRANLYKLIDLQILERVSKKERDKNAIYRFSTI